MKLALFPKSEEWGTGDEALDLRLSNALKSAAQNLSLQSVSEFYQFGLSLKTRAFNPAFSLTIEQVSKALLYNLHPLDCNDVLYKKMRGNYFQKERVDFLLEDAQELVMKLKKFHKLRYKEQIDFSLHQQTTSERNPFVEYEIKKASFDLQSKIIFKEFRQFLSGESVQEKYGDPFFLALKLGKNILVIESFAEIWYDKDQLFSISLMS